MRPRLTVVLLALLLALLAPLTACARETVAEHAANVYAAQELASHPVNGNLPEYSLSAADLATALHLQTISVIFVVVAGIWGVLQVLLLLHFRVVAGMRDRAGALSANRWVQGFSFTGMFLFGLLLLNLPLRIYGHSLGLRYGLSIQGWGSWAVDKLKSFALEWLVAGLLVMLLFWIIRRFPRRWWLVFWAASIPITFLAIFVGPYVNFLFNKYEPLAKNHPALAQRLSEVVARGHMDIPPERMFVMKASEKVTTMNADVEGFGASKRVVVWDTTIERMTPDEVVATFGHESGHYALNHIRNGALESFAGVFVGLWLLFHFVRLVLARYGDRWGVPSQSDWGTVAVLMLAFSLYGVLAEPVVNTLSRHVEHEADVYGQEAIHGLVADPQAAMVGTMQKLGKAGYEVPNPPRWEEFWLDGHPSTGRRAAFAHVYDPWAPGMAPKFFPKP